MKKNSFAFLIVCFLLSGYLQAQDSWKIVSGKILTPWAQQVDPKNPLPEHPRPQLVRKNWQNLNGLWNYQIQNGKMGEMPAMDGGKILVPYPVESALSGVGKTVGKDSTLWYERKFEVDKNLRGKRLLLHFGAVDWLAQVWVNGKLAGSHEGGYDPFTFDITPFLKKGKEQQIVVAAWDPTDEGPQPRGKQVRNPEGIWYTPVTGIWQTVWLEAVPESYIASTRHTVDAAQNTLHVHADIVGAKAGDQLRIIASHDGKQAAATTVQAGETAQLSIPDAIFWSPDNPHLYDLKLEIVRKGKVVDEADSYFAFRTIEMKKDRQGIQRMLLNGRFVFQYGPLDQGWWPDGLYTAPTDEALLYDVQETKDMGFNMIRKHVKVEPARWYYHCDRLGLLVWQDMPSGDLGGNRWDMRPGIISGKNHDKERTPQSEAIFKKEWKAIMDALYNFPSIVVWVPFNEAWGQFNTEEVTNWTVNYDTTRLVNSASGGNFTPAGHILDIHNYPDAVMPRPDLFGGHQILVLGEFGGLGLPVEGHTWQDKNNWGYQSFKNPQELTNRYKGLITDLNRLIPLGLSAAVYTQTTDVEIETNGLMTYDRQVNKIGEDTLRETHRQLYEHIIE